MANRLNPQQLSVLMREGTFHGLRSLLNSGQITSEQASEVLARSYGAILGELEEAKRELKHIQNALTQLENVCRSGARSRNAKVGDINHQQLGQNLVTFDGWVVSLMETDLTITGMLNPTHTRSKIEQFGIAMNALMTKRAAEGHPVLDDPSLFNGYFAF
jgi:hypothetical protein